MTATGKTTRYIYKSLQIPAKIYLWTARIIVFNERASFFIYPVHIEIIPVSCSQICSQTSHTRSLNKEIELFAKPITFFLCELQPINKEIELFAKPITFFLCELQPINKEIELFAKPITFFLCELKPSNKERELFEFVSHLCITKTFENSCIETANNVQ